MTAIGRVPRRTWLRYRFVFLALAPVMVLFIYLRIIPTGQALNNLTTLYASNSVMATWNRKKWGT